MDILYLIGQLRSQHSDLLKALQLLSDYSSNEDKNILRNARIIEKIVYKLAADLDLHLTLEDHLLYPYLKKSANNDILNSALTIQRELGGFINIFAQYKYTWNKTEKIVNEFNAFLKDTQKMSDLLVKRIHKEDNELFVLCEKVTWTQSENADS